MLVTWEQTKTFNECRVSLDMGNISDKFDHVLLDYEIT